MTATPITGYRELTPHQIETVNKIKEFGNTLSSLIGDLSRDDALNMDLRWGAIAQTDLQKGFMALVRSITRPEGF
jgi:hypothetical protein